ncbi:MAG: hypothetical protein ACLP7O_12295 [Terracidiphilus sp.]
MKVRFAFFLLGVSILLGYSSSSPLCGAQASQAPPHPSPAPAAPSLQSMPAKAQVYHIEVNTEENCLSAHCPQHLSASNFAVSQNGRQFPVRVSQPFKTSSAPASRFPTHLLVVFPPGAPRPKDARVVKSLNRVFSQGWLVSVNRSDGSFTPFSTTAMLAAELAAAPAAPLTARQQDLAAQSEIETLDKIPGRRLLLLDVGEAQRDPSQPWNSLVTKTDAQVYIVDGGKQVMVYYDQSWDAATRGPSPRGGDFVPKNVRFYIGGIFHEVKFSAAIKDVLADARYDYDLRFAIPDSQSDPAGPITLKLQNDKNFLPSEVKAVLYTVAKPSVNGRIITARTTPPQKLIKQGN